MSKLVNKTYTKHTHLLVWFTETTPKSQSRFYFTFAQILNFLIQISKLTPTSFFKILSYVHPVGTGLFHLFGYAELPPGIIVFHGRFHHHSACGMHTGVNGRTEVAVGPAHLRDPCVSGRGEKLAEVCKPGSSEPEAGIGKTCPHTTKPHNNYQHCGSFP